MTPVRMHMPEATARQLAAELIDGRGSDPTIERRLEQLWLLAVLIEQRRRTPTAERADFDRRADHILTALDPVPT